MGIKIFNDPNDFGKVPDPPEFPDVNEEDFCPEAPDEFDSDSFFCQECPCFFICRDHSKEYF